MRAGLCGALTLTVLWPLAAHAEEPRAGLAFLEWTRMPGAERCMSKEAAEIEVEASLARKVFAPREDAHRTLVVSIERTKKPRGFSAHMALFSATGASLGARDIAIVAESCEQATEAFTLALSIMADLPPSAEEQAARAKPRAVESPHDGLTPPPEVPTRTARRPGPASRREASPARDASTKVVIGVGAAGAFDTRSTVAPGAHLFAYVTPARFVPIGVGLLTTLRPHGADERTLWLSSTRVAATLCLPWQRGDFAFDACLGPQATVLVAWGAGFVDDRAGVGAVFGGVVELDARYRANQGVQLFATVALAATPQRVEMAFTDQTGAFRTAISSATLSPALSVGVAFDIFLGRP